MLAYRGIICTARAPRVVLPPRAEGEEGVCVCVCVCVSIYFIYFPKRASPHDTFIVSHGLTRCFWRSVSYHRRALFHQHGTCLLVISDFPHEVCVCARVCVIASAL